MRINLIIGFFALFFIWHTDAFSQPLQGIFYQPLSRDAVVTEAQWQTLLTSLELDGIYHLVLQWSEYDDVRFTGENQIIDNLIELLKQRRITWSLGLKMPSKYYAIMENESLEKKQLSLAHWFKQNRRLMMRLTIAGYPKRQGFVGWYLPLEVSEPYIEGTLLEVWKSGIRSLLNETSHPIAVSYFPSAYGVRSLFSQFNSVIKDPQLEIMVQLSNGLIDSPQRLSRFSLPCDVSIIVENFIQINNKGEHFAAKKRVFPELYSSFECHARYIFSLRYQPYSQYLPLED
jgi:hypothetical protein